jgi:hypothetical protein
MDTCHKCWGERKQQENNNNKNIKSRKKLNGKYFWGSNRSFYTNASANFSFTSSPFHFVSHKAIYSTFTSSHTKKHKIVNREPLPTPIFYLLWIKRWWQNEKWKRRGAPKIIQNIGENEYCVCLKTHSVLFFGLFLCTRLGWKFLRTPTDNTQKKRKK